MKKNNFKGNPMKTTIFGFGKQPVGISKIFIDLYSL